MPIYEYQCLINGHIFEAIQKITDKPLKSCKFCESPVRRLISNTSFVLKGGGWFKENYSKSSSAKNDPSPSPPKPSADNKKKLTPAPKESKKPEK